LKVVRASGNYRTHYIGATETEIVSFLQEAVDLEDPVTEFTILSHGNTSGMLLPGGKLFTASESFGMQITKDGTILEDHTQLFRDALAPDASVYLLGCNVAAGDYNMAKRMSRILPGRKIYGQGFYAYYGGFFNIIGWTKRYIDDKEQ
jgi:hypothetical protein